MTFVGDMWPNQDGEEPEWVKSEREQFNTYRDKNSDGKMDHEEVKDWIIPPDYDHTDAESKHLIYESDTNKVCNHKSYWLKCVTWFGNYSKQTRLNYFMLLILVFVRLSIFHNIQIWKIDEMYYLTKIFKEKNVFYSF